MFSSVSFLLLSMTRCALRSVHLDQRVQMRKVIQRAFTNTEQRRRITVAEAPRRLNVTAGGCCLTWQSVPQAPTVAALFPRKRPCRMEGVSVSLPVAEDITDICISSISGYPFDSADHYL